MRYVFLFFLAVLPALAAAVELDEHTRHLPLGQMMEVFEDPRGEIGIEDIASPAFEAISSAIERRCSTPAIHAPCTGFASI